MGIDKKDLQIITLLKGDSSLSTHKISKKTHIPITTIHNRIKKLKNEGIIKNFTINLDHKKLGETISAYILITINYNVSGTKIDQTAIAKKINYFDEVYSVSIIAGGYDMVIKVRTKDIEALNEFIINKLRNIEGIDKTQTLTIMKEI